MQKKFMNHTIVFLEWDNKTKLVPGFFCFVLFLIFYERELNVSHKVSSLCYQGYNVLQFLLISLCYKKTN